MAWVVTLEIGKGPSHVKTRDQPKIYLLGPPKIANAAAPVRIPFQQDLLAAPMTATSSGSPIGLQISHSENGAKPC